MDNLQQPSSMPHIRYQHYLDQLPVVLPDRTWPGRRLTVAPRWCSVDLRDGNQALPEPMNAERKLALFKLLVQLGYKEIEVGFPAASQTDFDFIRQLIEGNLIPADVTIQVLTQARQDLIERTYLALRGAARVIVHLYNSTSVLQREVVFREDRQGIIDLALHGARLCCASESQLPGTEIIYEYSPESFTGTEIDYALDICNQVVAVFREGRTQPVIVNLPATVEMATPNLYADAIEYMHRNLADRDHIILSLHPHNDRGTAVAAAELGLLAGADRVEGCLFGNGERTGNVDLVTLGLNLYTQGVDPQIDFTQLDHIREVVEYATQLPVGPRTPWVGELVYTAFSGSHQDAIKKGFDAMAATARALQTTPDQLPWAVPYLPLDPQDVGRTYEAVIRVNSQSGKGGIAYLLQTEHGLHLPRPLQIEFSKIVQAHTDATGLEITATDLWALFTDAYLPATEPHLKWGTYEVLATQLVNDLRGEVKLDLNLRVGQSHRTAHMVGNGPVDAFLAFMRAEGYTVDLHDYIEQAIGTGGNARAAAYVDLTVDAERLWGVGIDPDIMVATLRAIISAVNRHIGRGPGGALISR